MEVWKRHSQRKWCSKNHWLWRLSNWTEQSPGPWRLTVCSTEVWRCDPAFWPPFIILTFAFMQSVSPRFLPKSTWPSTVSRRFSSVSPLISFSITCVKKLWSLLSSETCSIACPAGPFQHISRCLKFTMRFRPCEHEVSACLKKISHTLLFLHPNAMYFMNINTKTQQRWKCIYKFAASLEHCPLLIKKLQRGRDKMKRQI